MNLDDTIVAVSSPPGAGWRGIVRLSGPRSFNIAGGLFDVGSGEPLDSVRGNVHRSGRVRIAGGDMPAAVILFRSPRSYTRQDVVEFHLLGAPALLGLLVESCLALGGRRAQAGEFTARAMLSGAFDVSQVHGIAGMIAARSDDELRAAERLLHGDLSRIANKAREELADLLSLVEGALDFADEPIEFIAPAELRRRLAALKQSLDATLSAGLRAERWGRLPRVVLAGPPNVGKSSLFNRLSGLDRAICTSMAGTTRDVLSAPLSLGSMECLLVDIAGLDVADGEIDAQAQAAARRAIDEADLVLNVVDASDAACRSTAPADAAAGITVLNKCDAVTDSESKALRDELGAIARSPICLTSAETGEGCDELKRRIEEALTDRPVDIHDAAIALVAEHRQALIDATAAIDRAAALAATSSDSLANADLVAAELHAAAQSLGVLVGQEDTEEMLGRIFSRFCVGK